MVLQQPASQQRAEEVRHTEPQQHQRQPLRADAGSAFQEWPNIGEHRKVTAMHQHTTEHPHGDARALQHFENGAQTCRPARREAR